MQLGQMKPGIALVGLEPDLVSTVVAIVPIAEGTVQVIYRLPDGTIKERLLNAADEASIALATSERPWAFDGDGATFQLACEAKRIDLAFLFDPMMAVHTSNVDPLPHQITAVYESMLPRQPLRFVLADDPGAGKTIMAGLYIRELVMRADARRVLIVARSGVPHFFYGKFRDSDHKVDASDLMRRMVKEELVKFDNTPLFPERKANTVNYTLSDAEATLDEIERITS
jgi:hypothetical protein